MLEIINKKPLSEIKEEKEKEKEDSQADVFAVMANLYEEMEEFKGEIQDEMKKLKSKIELLEGGAK
jgi:hypothetical protein